MIAGTSSSDASCVARCTIDAVKMAAAFGRRLVLDQYRVRAVALEDTLDLDIFSRIRKDWLTKDDAYLRRGERENG